MRQNLDQDMGEVVIEYLKQKGINLILGKQISKIEGNEKVTSILIDNENYPADIVLIATGVCPNLDLAIESGIRTEKGITTNNMLQTSIEKIYACGDCASIQDFFTGKQMPSNLGTNAVRQGKVAAINALGGNEIFNPVINATITEIFGLKIGAFGLTEDQLTESKKEYVKAKYKGKSKAEYYPGAKDIFVKLIANLEGKVLGVQIIGEEGVFARTLAIAFAVQKGMTVQELSKSENCYCPPLSPTIDPLQICAELLLKRIKK
jgi:NADH oxidase (H2O2-forming)